ncbi:VWA domain-containing protein [Streptomyces sp. R08]|uniref:VWA domain-containing protein n=1 Tax=Streptomyces sp. R08 TaxID=3238624 RepID=A0AB39MB80_9ACTN
MGILTLLRNAFGRSRKERAAEAEGAERTPSHEPPTTTTEPDAKVPSPSPEPDLTSTPTPSPAATVPEPRPSSALEDDDEHDLVAAAFDNVTVPKPATSVEGAEGSGVGEERATEVAEPVTEVAEPVTEVAEVAEPEAVAEPVTEAVVTPVVEAEPVAEVVAEPVAEPAAEVTPEVEAKPVVEAAPVVETVAEPVAEPAAEVTPEAEAKPVAEAAPVVETVAETEPEPVAEVAAEPEVEVAPVAETEPEVEPVAEPVAEAEPAVEVTPEAEPEPVAETEPEVAPVAEAEPEAVAEPVAEAEPVAASEPEAVRVEAPEPVAEPVVEPVVEPVAEPSPVLAPVAAAGAGAAADGGSAPQGPLAPDDETVTGGAGGETFEAEGVAEDGGLDSAAAALAKANLTGTQAKLYLVLDRSSSMRPYYKDGSAQALADQTLALATHLDPDPTPNVHVIFFSTEVDGTTDLTPTSPENAIDKAHAGLGRMGRTSYHAAVEAVLTHYDQNATPGTPALVVFQTDGAPDAKTPATLSLTDAAKSHASVFFSFVAFGDHDNKAFDYLRKLKTDNTAFFHAGPTPLELTDAELYDGVLIDWRP